MRARRDALLARTTVGALLTLLSSQLIGWAAALAWLTAYLVTLGLEFWLLSRRETRAHGPRSVLWEVSGVMVVGAGSAVFGALAAPLWLRGGTVGGVFAVLILFGAIINTVLTTQRSRLVVAVSLAPNFAWLAACLVFARLQGATADFEKLGALTCLAFAAYAIALWGKLESVREGEARAQRLADERLAELEAVVEAKAWFVAAMRLELRTPLEALRADAAALDARAREPLDHDFARRLDDTAHRLLTLLDDTLDHAELEGDRAKAVSEVFPLRRLLAETLTAWRAEAERKGLTLRLEGAEQAPDELRGDPGRLRRVLNTLLSNAVQVTAEGEVVVSLAAWPAEEDACALRIVVTDRGEAADLAAAGADLALVIARHKAHAMGGELTARPRAEGGATRTLALTLPLVRPGAAGIAVDDDLARLQASAESSPADVAGRVPSDKQEEAYDEDADRPLRVLVADDHEINRRAVELVLAPTGAIITTAVNGREALEAAMLTAFDLIVMDVRMPEMNGREATRLIRSRPGPNRDTPVIAVTADSDVHNVEACRQSGMNWFVAKPIDPAKLIDTAVRALEQAEQARAAEHDRHVA
jgi:CheY-like chemotaxis protein/signal transduction histidine kinase